MTDKLIRYGLLCMLVMFGGNAIIWFTNYLDINGKIGASIIVTACLFGNGIAMIIRGRMWDKYHQQHGQSSGGKTHD